MNIFKNSLIKMKDYRQDRTGQIAVWFGIVAFPLVLISTFVVDYQKANHSRTELKTALDSASLAAVTDQRLTESERAAYAEQQFKQNFSMADKFSFTVLESGSERVAVKAEGVMPVTVSRSLGINGIDLLETSTAVLTQEEVICVLTLNPDGKRSFRVSSGSTFSAPSCAVQVNSTHNDAAVVDNSSRAQAERFCVAGGAKGEYEPYVNTQCSQVDDPYKDKKAPPPGLCIKTGLNLVGGIVVLGDSAVLLPGTYCDDVRLDGKNVTFLPGTYIFDNVELRIRGGSQARADGVTFVMRGPDANLRIEDGSDIYIKAPATGDLAGLAIFQDVQKTGGKDDSYPNNTSELKGGSRMSIVGTVYLPTQTIEISGSSYGNQAPATSFIGYDVDFGQNSNIEVRVDHKTAGLPPILPRADEGARLVE